MDPIFHYASHWFRSPMVPDSPILREKLVMGRLCCPGNVHEYIESFCDIVHQPLAHDPSFPSSVITNRFIDGLKKEIKSIVMVHRPRDLDSASSLALL
jgi:hypothetical protein